MRFKFEFISVSSKAVAIPLNYQYYLHSWFYNVLSKADEQFAEWLHDRGFTVKAYRYKLFSFSWLWFEKNGVQIVGDRMVIKPNVQGSLIFSFYLEEIAEKFIIGLFTEQKINIRGTGFLIKTVRRLTDPKFETTMRYRTMTPIKVSLDLGHGQPTYLSPDHAEFARLVFDNLQKKLLSVGERVSMDDSMQFKLLSDYKSKLITVKSGSPKENKIRGFMFDFELTAPLRYQKMGYYAGFGESNPLGFGLVKILPKNVK